jgi:hypothetical protein
MSDLPSLRLCSTIVAQNDLRARQIGRTMPDAGYESDLSDAQWAIVEEFIPPPKPGGRPVQSTCAASLTRACTFSRLAANGGNYPRIFHRGGRSTNILAMAR